MTIPLTSAIGIHYGRCCVADMAAVIGKRWLETSLSPATKDAYDI